MNFRENKLELGIVVMTVVMAVGFFRAFGGSDAEKDLTQEISYEMPRPKSDLVGEFGLGDREIDRQYVNPFSRTAAAVAATAPAKPAAKAKPKVNPRAAAQAAAAANFQAQQRRAAYVRVVEKARSEFLAAQAAAAAQQPPQAPVDEIGAPASPAAAAADEEQRKDKRSPAQWRALLSGDATKANMDKLVEALADGDADEATFYSIVDELLKSQTVAKHEVGLHGLAKRMTAKSFAYAVKGKNEFPADVQAKIDPYLTTYATVSKQGVLASLVVSQDVGVALAAANVVYKGILAAKSQVPTGPTGQSGVAQWARFGQIFQRLVTNANLQGVASQILSALSGQA